MKNINTTSKTNTQKTPQTILALAMIFLIAVIAVSFTMTKFMGKSSQATQEVIESLMAENEENPLAESYLVTDNCISRVPPKTEVEAFVADFFKKGEVVSVYKDENCTEAVTDGFVASGMYAKYEANNRVYDISVLGDIHEKTGKVEGGATLAGDGVLNQIELTRDIRSCVDEKWMIDDEAEKKSADVNCTNQIDELSVKTIIDYLVYGDLNIPEVDDVLKPSIEIVSGNMNEHTVYTSNVVLKITENDENALKTVYKITGDKNQDYKEAVSGEEVVLNENGTYKITAYTYGKLDNKSKIEYKIITIDKTANYTMEYYLEGLNGEYTKVDEDTKTIEGIIGETVDIERKQYTDYELDVDNSNVKLQGIVLEDDSLVLKAYYTRKEFTYTFVAGDNIVGVSANKVGNTDGANQETQSNQASTSVTAKWGEKIKINATVAEQAGYTINWKNWENINDENEKITAQSAELTIEKANKNYKAIATKTTNEYGITYELNNGSLPANVKNKEKYTVETENFTLTNPSRPGYEFKGWTGGVVKQTGEIDDTAEAGNTPNTQIPTIQMQIKSGSLGNRKYTANWEAINNTPYKIQYYTETLKTGEFKLEQEENKGGTTDTTATVSGTAKSFTGFEFDASNENNVTEGKITADGKLVLKLYYTRKTYDLTIVAGNNVATASAQGETLETGSEGETNVGKYTTSSSKQLKYKYGQKVNLSAVLENVAGYEYGAIHWASSNTELISNIEESEKQITMVAGNITLTAVAERNAIEYTISYHPDGGILPEGKTIPETYTVESSEIVIHNLKDGSKSGYNFAGWTGSNGNVPSLSVTIPTGSIGNKEYTANWTEADFGYTVEYYYEKNDGYEKDASKTETATAKYNSEVTEFIAKPITGYELKQKPAALKIKTDVTQNVMKVYYVKKKHTVTLQKDANIASVTGFGEYKYGDEVDINAVLKTEDGYTITFAEWQSQTSGISNISTQSGKIIIPDSDVTLKATATKKADSYTIRYMSNGGKLSQNPDSYTIESNDITLIPPTKQGYVFAGWTGGTEKTNYGTTGNTENPDKDLVIRKGSMGDRLYEANWVGDTKTAYKVEHYKENLDGTYPTSTTDIDNKEGTTDAEVIAAHKDFDGFEFDSTNTQNVLVGKVKPDGSLVLKVYYKRCYYSVDLVADTNIEKVTYSVKDGIGAKQGTANTQTGKELHGEFKYGTQINISADVEQATGYTTKWSKWQTNDSQKIVDQATQTALIGVPSGDVTLTAKATRTANTYKYHVQYYYDNVLDNTKTVENEVAYGTKITSYSGKNITGFIFDKDENKPLTVTENEDNNVIKVYYKHVDYDITYDLDGGEQTQSNPDKYSVLTDTFTLIKPVKSGYTFLGWTGSNGTNPQEEVTIAKGSTGNKNYKANWRAKTDIKYVIEHYEEGLDGNFALVNDYTEELFGTTGSVVTTEGHIKNITGFSYSENNSVNSAEVKGDGSTSLKIYYVRNEYTLNLKAGENIETVSYNVTNEHAIAEGYPLSKSGSEVSVKLKYGAGLTVLGTLKTEEHYNITNGKWTSNNSSVRPSTLNAEVLMPASDVALTASATKTGLPYKYYTEYYFENTLDRSYEETANYKTIISKYVDRNKTGYKFDHYAGLPLEITENEATNIIKVYYVLENYDINYDLDGGTLPIVDEQALTNPEKYNVTTETFTLNYPKKQGYVFLGWTGSNGTEAQTEVSIAKGSTGNKSFKANWKPSDETEYKVEHYIEKLDSTEDGESNEVNQNNYTLYVPQGVQTTFTGTTGNQATGTSIEITGFTYSDTKSAQSKTATIAADGSTVVKLYYTRNTYKLKLTVGDENISLVSNGGTTSKTESEKTYKYEQQVEIGAATSKITGYITSFTSWISNNENLMANINQSIKTITIPAGDITLTATGSKIKAKYTYKVYYYYEDANGEMVEDENLRFTSDALDFETEVMSYPDQVKTGYELYKAETVPFNISANPDDNIVKVYYKLINYDISYNLKEGELQNNDTNPLKYNILSQDITLKNPEREGYLFLGWTGGVVNTEGQVDSSLPTGTSENVTEPTKTLKIEKGSLGNRKYTANWAERTYVVTVKHYLQGTGPAYNNEPIEVANEEVFTTQTLGENYEVQDLILDYNEQGVVLNTDIKERNYLDDTEFKVVGDSGNTSGKYTKQDINVIFYYQYYPVIKITSSPVTELVNKEYTTIKDALQAMKKAGLTKSSELTTMQILRDVKNESFIVDNLNVQIDLNNYTINSNAELTDNSEQLEALDLENATVMLKNSKFTLVDLGVNRTGKLISKNCSGVFVSSDSEFTLGVEERPVYQYPEIDAKIDGVKKQVKDSVEGIFNFFDGKIIADNLTIDGTVDLTPLIYVRGHDESADGRNVAILTIVSDKEARIERTTYATLEDAIAAVDEGTEQTEIVLLKDLLKEDKVVFPEYKNIKLDLAGYTFKTTKADYVLENRGKLEIVDSSASEENIYGNGLITSDTYSTILNSVRPGKLITQYNDMETTEINGFTKLENNTFVSNNYNARNTTAHGYIEIDLTSSDESKNYAVTVNAEVSSQLNNDIGYATITENTELPEYNQTSGRFIYISGQQIAADYTTYLKGGKKYYLHFGYRKNSSTDSYDDIFTINSIKLQEKCVGELLLTNGNYCVDVAGTSANKKYIVYSDGNITIGKPESAYKVNMYGTKSYTTAVYAGQGIIVNDVNINMTGSSSQGIYSIGNIEVKNGNIQSKDVSITSSEDSPDGVAIIIKNLITNQIKINSNAVTTIEDSDISNLYLSKNANVTLKDNNISGTFSCSDTVEALIKSGTFNTMNFSGARIIIENGTFNGTVNAYGNMTIMDGTFNGSLALNGTTVIENGQFNSEGSKYRRTITNYGELNIIKGTFKGTIQNRKTLNVYDDAEISVNGYIALQNEIANCVINIYGGNISSTSHVVNNSGENSITNIYGGTLTTTSTTNSCIYNSDGIINIGNKNDETVGADKPLILATLGYPVSNKSAIVNFYDGIIKGKTGQVSLGRVNEIPDGKDILESYEGENNEIEVNTIGVSQRPVALIGETEYYRLQDALDDCPDSDQTTVKIIDKIILARTATIESAKNVVLDLNGFTIKSCASGNAIENKGTLSIVDNNTNGLKGKISSVGGTVINNESTLNLGNILIEKHSYNEYGINNIGNLNINGTTINMDYAKSATGIMNNENAELSIDNLTIELSGFNGSDHQYITGIYNKSSKDVNLSNSNIKASGEVLINEGTGTLTIKDCNMELINYEYGTSTIIDVITGTVIIDGGEYNGKISGQKKGKTIVSNSNGTVQIKNGYFHTGKYLVYLSGSGTVQIDGGNCNNIYAACCIVNKNADLTINQIDCTCDYFISENSGKVTINNATVNSSGLGINNNASGDITINNIDLVSSGNQAIWNVGKLTVLDGRIENTYGTSNQSAAIYNKGSTALLIVGNDDGTANKTAPSLIGKLYGITNVDGTFEFYDGIIEGAVNNSINNTSGTFIYANDYNLIKETVTKTINETSVQREIAYLDVMDVAKVGNNKFKKLESAVEFACQGEQPQTIEILRDITIVNADNTIVIPQNKDIKIDLKGYKITALNNKVFENNGTLEIVDNPETSGETEGETTQKPIGEIKSTVGVIIDNKGTLKLSGGKISSTAYTYQVDNTAIKSYTIINTGNTIVDGATVDGRSVFLNDSNGEIKVVSGLIERTDGNTSNYIFEQNSGKLTVDAGTLNGDYTFNINNGIVNINGGTINSRYNQFKNDTILTMTGGTIKGYGASYDHYLVSLSNNAQFKMSGGTVDTGVILYNSSSIDVTGGSIINSYYDIYLLGENTNGKIDGGTFEATRCNIISKSNNTLNILKGTFTASDDACVDCEQGKIKIAGGTFTSNETTDNTGTIYNNKGEIEITKATINGRNGIFSRDNGNKLTLGVKDSTINNEDIVINATNYGIVSEGINKEFNYYDGIIKAKTPIYGEVHDVPDGYRLNKVANGELYDCTLTPVTEIARIEGKSTYLTLQDAVDSAENGDVIEITKTYYPTTKEICEIPQDKDVTINLNGFVIENYGNMFTNKGSLKLIGLSTETPGEIKGYSNIFIDNTGSLEINANIEQTRTNALINNSGSGTVKIVNGVITINDNKYYTNSIIKTSSSGKVEICDGTFTVNQIETASNTAYRTYFINNTGVGDIDILGGQVLLKQNVNYANIYGIYTENTNENEVAKIRILGGNISKQGNYYSYGVYSEKYTDLEITGGVINCRYGISVNGGTTTINGQNVDIQGTSEAIIINSGTVNIENGNITSSLSGWNKYGAISNNGTLNISGGTIKNTSGTAIYNKSGKRVEITGGTIQGGTCGIYTLGDVIMTDGIINNVSDYGVYIAGGLLTLGENNLSVSRTIPSISSEGNGVYNGSVFNFYDGIITGSTGAINGQVNDTPEGFIVQTTEDLKVATLDLSSQFNDVAMMDGGYYTTIQLAINDAKSNKKTIYLQSDVAISQPLQISDGQHITIDMQGHKIIMEHGDYVIQNNGELTIVDTISDNSVIQNLETGTTSEEDRIGTGIYNSATGTLTIGIKEDAVKYAPIIIGDKYGIENHGILNIYDGQIKGVTAPIGVTQSNIEIPDGYTLSTEEISGVKTMKLVVQ